MHIITYISSIHTLFYPPPIIFSTSPGDDRRAPESDLKAVGRERERMRQLKQDQLHHTVFFSAKLGYPAFNTLPLGHAR